LDFKAAVAILRLAQPAAGALTIGPTDAEEIVRRIVQQRRDAMPDPLDDALDDAGLPPFDQHVADVWAELEARAQEPERAVGDFGCKPSDRPARERSTQSV
jgi:hypothetical protein